MYSTVDEEATVAMPPVNIEGNGVCSSDETRTSERKKIFVPSVTDNFPRATQCYLSLWPLKFGDGGGIDVLVLLLQLM